MGVIIRQGIKHSIVNYLGAGVGIISMLFVYPRDTEAYGLVRFLTDSAVLFIPLTLLGANVLPVRFFPELESEENKHQGFLGWLLLLSLVGLILTTCAFWVGWDYIIGYYSEVSELYRVYLVFFVPILIIRALIQLLIHYISNFHRIVIPSILNDLLFKIMLPIFILLKVYGIWGYRELVFGVLFNFVFVLIGLILYLIHLGQWSLKINWKAYNKPLLKTMRIYAFYGVLGTISSTIAVNLDVFMIGTMVSPEATGVYGIASIMANLINRPQVALSMIAAPIIMKAWQSNTIQSIEDIYRKSSVNALIPGLLIFLLIWLNLPDIYQIMPNSQEIQTNKTALLLLGLAFLLNLLTGVNTEVMIYSNLFKTHFYAVLILSVVNIVLNYYFITAMGITGAALATLIAFSCYNFYKCLIIYRRMGIHPFTKGIISVIGIGLGLWWIVGFLPLTGNIWVNLVLRSSLLGIIYVFLIYKLKASPEINSILEKGMAYFKAKINV
jgi:O-antigen/teichoic acid export membrane protein